MATDLSERQGCLGLLKRLFGHGENPATDKELPYHVRDDFLSPAERSFYGVLTEGVAGLYVVCPKVNVADLLYVARLRENRGYFNKIQQKHVDFVLCEPGPMRPVAVSSSMTHHTSGAIDRSGTSSSIKSSRLLVFR